METNKMNCLIFPYKTPYGYYVYDSNRNEILSVQKELFELIIEYNINMDYKKEKYTEETKESFQELLDLGYLLPPQVKKIEHPFTGLSKNMVNRKIDMITLQLTQNCNLRCSYCIYSATSNLGQRSHNKKHMSFETAKEALMFYKQHSEDSNMASIGFYGGEPLLEFELIKKIVDYADKLFEGKEICYAVTTNATLLSEDIIDYLVEHHFVITLSIDGPEKIQDKNRKFKNGLGSYKVVENNILTFFRKHPYYMKNITVSMVIDEDSNYNDIIELFKSEPFRDVKLTYTPVEKDATIADLSREYIEQYNYDTFLGYIQFYRNEGKKCYPSKIIEQDFNALESKLENFKPNILSACSAPSGPCIPGKTRLFINCLGEFYPCERVNENELMKIGTLYSGFDYDKINDLLNVGRVSKDKCMNCWAFQLCDVCVKRADDNGIMSERKKVKFCEITQGSAFNQIRNKILAYENFIHNKKMSKLLK